MITDTEGIILRQFKTVNGRTMLVMFSRKLGKISVATNMTGGGKNRSALSAKPFTYGNYELYKGRDLYDLNSGYRAITGSATIWTGSQLHRTVWNLRIRYSWRRTPSPSFSWSLRSSSRP